MPKKSQVRCRIRHLSRTQPADFLGLQVDTDRRFATYVRTQSMAEIIETVKGSEQYQLYNTFVKGWGECIEYDKISEEFEKQYGRLPQYSADDVTTVLSMTLAKKGIEI